MAAVIGSLRAELSATIAQFQRDMGKAADTVRSMSKEFTKVSRDFQQTGRQMQSVGAALTKTITLPLVAIGAAAAKVGIDFESSFAGVRKTVDASEAEFAQMSTALRNLAKTIPVNVNELNRLAEAAGALGIPKGEIVDFARVMAELGVTTNVTSDEAAESIAKIQNIFGAAGKDTERFASTLVALGNSGASTEQQILSMATRVASAGNILGLTQGQVLGISSAIADVGIEAEAGGSAISAVMTKMAKAVSGGGQALEAFAKVAGQSSAEFSTLFKTDAAEAITKFVEGLGRIKKGGGDLIKTLDELGVEEIRQSNLLRSLAGSSDNFRASLDRQKKAWDENTALQKEANERFKTTASQLVVLGNRIKDVGITLFSSMKPAIDAAIAAVNRLAPILDKIAKAFGELPGSVQLAIIAVAGVAAAMGPLLFVSGQVISSFGTLLSVFGKTGIGTKALTTAIGGLQAALIAIRNINIGTGLLSVLVGAGTAAAAGTGIGAMYLIAGKLADDFKAKLEAQAAAQQRAGKTIPALREGYISLADAQQKAAEAGQDLVDGVSVTIAQFAKVSGGAGSAGSVASFTAQLEAANAEIAKLSPAVRVDLAKAIESGAFEMEDLQKQTGLSERALKLFKERLDETKKSTKDAAEELKDAKAGLGEVRDEIDKVARSIDQLQDNVEEGIQAEELANVAAQFAQIAAGVDDSTDSAEEYEQVLNEIYGLSGNIGRSFDEQRQKAVKLSDVLRNIPTTLAAAFTGGGGLRGGIKAIGTQLGESLFGEDGALAGVTKKATAGLSKVFGKTIGGALGAAIPAIGSLIGPAIEGIGKLFGKIFGTAGRDAIRDFAKGFGGFDALHDQLGTLGAEGERLWIALTQGVGRNNPEQAKAAIDAVTKALEAQKRRFEELQGSIGTVSEKLSGITVITPEIQSALDAVFNESTTEGYLQKLKDLNGALDEQAQKYADIEAALTKYGISFTEAGTAFQQAKLNEKAVQLRKEFNVLRGAGVDINVQMRAMGQTVRDFVKEAQKAGVEVPESMREVIQVAIDAGEVFDDNGNKITDINQLGLKFGTTMETAMKTVSTAVDRLNQILEALAKHLGIELPKAAEKAADGINDAFDGLSPKVRVGFEIDPAKLPSGYEEIFDPDRYTTQPVVASRGGKVTPFGLQHLQTGGFARRGTDTVPAMLTPGELVLNAAQQRNVSAELSRPVSVVVENHFHGSVLAEKEYIERHVTPSVLDGVERYFQKKFGRLQLLAST